MPGNKILEVIGLNKRFGGQQVTKDLNFHLYEGDQAAIIGPNGAGKTTFFNLLTGYYRADSGSVLFDGREIAHLPSYLIARAGMTRAFQVSNIFPKLTALENVRSAVQAQMGRAFDLFSRSYSRDMAKLFLMSSSGDSTAGRDVGFTTTQ